MRRSFQNIVNDSVALVGVEAVAILAVPGRPENRGWGRAVPDRRDARNAEAARPDTAAHLGYCRDTTARRSDETLVRADGESDRLLDQGGFHAQRRAATLQLRLAEIGGNDR